MLFKTHLSTEELVMLSNKRLNKLLPWRQEAEQHLAACKKCPAALQEVVENRQRLEPVLRRARKKVRRHVVDRLVRVFELEDLHAKAKKLRDQLRRAYEQGSFKNDMRRSLGHASVHVQQVVFDIGGALNDLERSKKGKK